MRKIGIRILISLIVVAAYIGWRMGTNTDETPLNKAQNPAEAYVGGDFVLTNQYDKEVSSKDFRGKIMVVFFGFTNCPDICPAALLNLTNILEKLGDKANDVAPVFITVDPERDTPEAIREYLQSFDSRIVGLTGTREAVDKVADAYKVYHAAQKKDEKENTYMVNHSGYIYVMNREGKYLKHFASNDKEEAITTYLKNVIEEN